MATFKKQRKLIAEAQPEEPIEEKMTTSSSDLVTELTQEPVKQKPKAMISKHQFDESGLQYEGKKFSAKPLLATLFLFVLIGAVAFFTLTSEGKNLLQSITNPSDTSARITNTDTTTSISNEEAYILPPARDFSESTEAEIRTQLEADGNLLIQELSPGKAFSTPDWQLELGL